MYYDYILSPPSILRRASPTSLCTKVMLFLSLKSPKPTPPTHTHSHTETTLSWSTTPEHELYPRVWLFTQYHSTEEN